MNHNYYNYVKIFQDTVNVLKGIWENGYIHWIEGKHPYNSEFQKNVQNHDFVTYSYEDIDEFYEDEHFLIYDNPFMNDTINNSVNQLYLNIVLKREKVFSLKYNNKSVLKFSLSYDFNTNSIIVTCIKLDRQVDFKEHPISEFIKFCKDNFLDDINIKNHEVNMYLYVKEKMINVNNGGLEKINFSWQSTLFHETESGNVNLYIYG